MIGAGIDVGVRRKPAADCTVNLMRGKIVHTEVESSSSKLCHVSCRSSGLLVNQ
jgi:hypothetical protein